MHKPVLAAPALTREFKLVVTVSDFGAVAILFQEDLY